MRQHIGHRHFGGLAVAAVLVLDHAVFQTFVADGDAVWHTDQFPIGKHGTGALATVVQDHVHTQGQQFFVELVGSRFHVFAAIHIHRANHGCERCNRVGPK